MNEQSKDERIAALEDRVEELTHYLRTLHAINEIDPARASDDIEKSWPWLKIEPLSDEEKAPLYMSDEEIRAAIDASLAKSHSTRGEQS